MTPWILYGICAAMLFVALAAVLPTVLKAETRADADALDELARRHATDALRDEKARLDRDLAEGRMSRAEYEPLLADLRRRVLEEQKAAADPEGFAPARPLELSRPALGAVVASLMTAVAVGSYAFLGSPEMPELQNAQRVMEGKASAEAIEDYLKTAPKDGGAWRDFAHRKIEAGDYRSAARALRTAREVEPKFAADPAVSVEYVAAVLTAEEAELYEDANRVMKTVRAAAPEDPQVERLAVMAAMRAGDWTHACDVVRGMLERTPKESPEYAQIARTLEMFEARAAGRTPPGQN